MNWFDSEECPRCHVTLRHVAAEYEDGYLFTAAYSECPSCDWQPGDVVLNCDYCGEWSDDLEETEDGLYCPECVKQNVKEAVTA